MTSKEADVRKLKKRIQDTLTSMLRKSQWGGEQKLIRQTE